MRKTLFTLVALISFGLSFGQFGEQVVISSEIESPRFLASTDINEDGLTDLLYVGDGNKIYWLKSLDNNGNFDEPSILYNTGNNYLEIQLLDIDNDNLEDIVFLHANHQISFLKKLDPTGNYAPQELLISNVGFFTYNFQVLDIDEDGDLDIVTFSSETGSFESKINSYENLNNTLEFVNEFVLFTGSDFGEDKLYVSDIDGDGLKDIIGYDNFSNNGGVENFYIKNIQGSGFGEIVTLHNFQFSQSQQTTILSFDIADINTDGLNDIMFTTYREVGQGFEEYDRYWLENIDGLGSFSDPINSIYLSSFYTLGDVDNDEDLDIIFSDENQTVIDWVEDSTGMGGYIAKSEITNEVLGLNNILLVDLNVDGYLDVVSSSSIDDKIAWYPNQLLSVDSFEKLNLKVVPNPATSEVLITGLLNIESVFIYDTFGKVVMEIHQEKTIDISSLKTGIYFLNITTVDGANEIHRIIKK